MIAPKTNVISVQEQRNAARWKLVKLGAVQPYPNWTEAEHLETMEKLFVTAVKEVGEVVFYPTEKILFDESYKRYTKQEFETLVMAAEPTDQALSEEEKPLYDGWKSHYHHLKKYTKKYKHCHCIVGKMVSMNLFFRLPIYFSWKVVEPPEETVC